MSKLETFFVELPRACGITGELAVLEGDANSGRFSLEVRDRSSVFRQIPGQTTMERMKPAWAAWEDFANQEILSFAKRLACYAADCYGFNKSGVPHPQNLNAVGAELASVQGNYPTIMALYTVQDATTQSNWV
jgi:hypothetical protein